MTDLHETVKKKIFYAFISYIEYTRLPALILKINIKSIG